MKATIVGLLSATLFSLVTISDANAHSAFKAAFKARYDLDTVSCNACHSKKDEIAPSQADAYDENKRQFRNGFGKRLEALLKGTNVTKTYYDAKAKTEKAANPAQADAIRDAAKQAITAEFIKALAKLEKTKAPDGQPWPAYIKAGKIPSTKP
jgi:hypothetical protein